MTKPLSLALIGAGAMGGAMLRAWLDDHLVEPGNLAVFDPVPSDGISKLAAQRSFVLNPGFDAISCDVAVLAVKPQLIGEVAPLYASFLAESLLVSIMAGKSVAAISALFGGHQRVIRAMPNLPAAIGAGASGIYAPAGLAPWEREIAEQLLAAAGEAIFVDSEGDLDAVTTISGSGPAYYFLLTEALAQAGQSLGLSEAVAERLARATLIGAGALQAADPRSPEELRRAVTSKAGVTEAALSVFDRDPNGMRTLAKEAVAVALKRAKELTE